MILRITLVLLGLSGYCHTSFSQAPGFAGKRLIMAVEGYAFPSLRFIYTDDRSLSLHTHRGLNLEYVWDRRFSAGLILTKMTTQVGYNYQNRSGNSMLQGTNIGAFVKTYTFLRRGNIAPIGPFQKFELQYLTYFLIDQDRAFYPDGRTELGAFRDWLFTYTLGSQHVLPPRITYQWGIQGGWILNVGQIFPFSAEDKYLSDVSTSRLRDQFAINLTMGVGILLY